MNNDMEGDVREIPRLRCEDDNGEGDTPEARPRRRKALWAVLAVFVLAVIFAMLGGCDALALGILLDLIRNR